MLAESKSDVRRLEADKEALLFQFERMTEGLANEPAEESSQTRLSKTRRSSRQNPVRFASTRRPTRSPPTMCWFLEAIVATTHGKHQTEDTRRRKVLSAC